MRHNGSFSNEKTNHMSEPQIAASDTPKWVYSFGAGTSEGSAGMKELLGGKGANLAEMANLGLPAPPGFTITTDVCTAYYKNNRKYPPGLAVEVEKALKKTEKIMGHARKR